MIEPGSCIQIPATLHTTDVFAEAYYASIFNGATSPELNAMLLGFLADLNFLTLFLSDTGTGHPDFFTALKIRLVASYHVLRSIQILQDSAKHLLTAVSLDHATRTLDLPVAHQLLDQAFRPLRNTLVHYKADTRLDATKFDLLDPFFGLHMAAGIDTTAEALGEMACVGIRRLQAILSDWMVASQSN